MAVADYLGAERDELVEGFKRLIGVEWWWRDGEVVPGPLAEAASRVAEDYYPVVGFPVALPWLACPGVQITFNVAPCRSSSSPSFDS